jgi:hypothetical protein
MPYIVHSLSSWHILGAYIETIADIWYKEAQRRFIPTSHHIKLSGIPSLHRLSLSPSVHTRDKQKGKRIGMDGILSRPIVNYTLTALLLITITP